MGGYAGVRVSGNAVLVAPVVLNASGLQVRGTTAGVPTVPQVNVGALTAAGNATAATNQFTAPVAEPTRRASIYTIEVIGYGGGEKDRDDSAAPTP